MVKDYLEIGEFTSLGALIDQLAELRDSLPAAAEPELRIRGNAFGRHLCVGFMRPLTAEEAACEGRYSDRDRPTNFQVAA